MNVYTCVFCSGTTEMPREHSSVDAILEIVLFVRAAPEGNLIGALVHRLWTLLRVPSHTRPKVKDWVIFQCWVDDDFAMRHRRDQWDTLPTGIIPNFRLRTPCLRHKTPRVMRVSLEGPHDWQCPWVALCDRNYLQQIKSIHVWDHSN